MEENSKKLKVLVIVAILLGVAVLGLSGYIVYDKVLNNNVDSEKNNNGELLTAEEAITEGKRLYDKATEIYSVWVLRPYCGVATSDIQNQELVKLGDSGYGNGNYYKSNFSSLDSLKDYLKQWLSGEIVNDKVRKSYEWNDKTYYDYVEDTSLLYSGDDYTYVDYVLKDGSLYCRFDVGKGWLSLYQDEYDIEVDSIENNKITYTITSTYVKNNAKCNLGTLGTKDCTEADYEYVDTSFVIERNSKGNFVVAEFTLHN